MHISSLKHWLLSSLHAAFSKIKLMDEKIATSEIQRWCTAPAIDRHFRAEKRLF